MFGIQQSTIITLILLVLIIAGAAWYAWSVQPDVTITTSSAVDRALGDGQSYTLTDLDGNPFEMDQFEGEVLVINSWASWCPFCVNELPDFDQVAREYADRGVTVLAVNRAEPINRVRAFLNAIPSTDTIVYALDSSDGFYESIGGFTMPETIFYDQAGNLVLHKRGFMDKAEIRLHIETALANSN